MTPGPTEASGADTTWRIDSPADAPPVWTNASAGLEPGRRDGAALAYDAWRGRLLLVGGRDLDPALGTGTYFADSWEFNGDWWELRPVPPTLAGRAEHGLAFDAARGDAVLFGGIADDGLRGDTWRYDGDHWTDASGGVAPSPRRGATMTYDATAGAVVLFGGEDASGPRDDTWRWDGAAWAELAVGTRPPARALAGFAFDAATDRLVLFGGVGAAGALADTWFFDGTTWTDAALAAHPPAGRAALAFDPARGRVLAFEGSALWELATTWQPINASAAPPVVTGNAVAYDGWTRQLATFGGDAGVIGERTLARFAFASDAYPPEACADGEADTDGDGLAGCADPDCWAVCAPGCPPLTSCAAAAPTCGDGACAEWRETVASCPEDCAP
ncbi:MAG: kelch repeat-containing protein [Kofleriaceae bacterium]